LRKLLKIRNIRWTFKFSAEVISGLDEPFERRAAAEKILSRFDV
jgi:hypothetical protein